MNSTNGTLLDDAELKGEAELVDGDVVRIGDTEFRFEVGCLMLRVDDQAFRTDTGRQRNANEDSFFVRAPIFVVADGMGGAQAGEVASKAAAEAFDRDLPDAPPERVLRETIEAANREIHEHARADPSLAGMGTTLTAAIVDAQKEEVGIGHVGDSRAYRLRDGKLERLTRDHSLVEEMRRKGQLTDAQAEDHPQRSIITRALGPEPDVDVDVHTVPAQPGDVFLLCSDGLTTMVDDERIAAHPRRRHLDDRGGAGAGRRGQPGRRARQHHRARLPPRGRRVSARAAPEGATLIGPSAEEAGLTATEVRRRAAAAAAKERREQLAAKPRAAGCAPRRRPSPRSSSSAPSPSAPGTGIARSGSWGPTPAAASRSTAACPTNCPSGSSSTPSATRARSRPRPCHRAAAMRSPATTCARAPTRSP